ncbi:MAG: hypothetical protein PHT33_00265 [bacterium]|nr:hypothetical protein [bacterium]
MDETTYEMRILGKITAIRHPGCGNAVKLNFLRGYNGMIKQQRTCDYLYLLVGSNPFPNYLASLILEPQSVCLIYSPETEEIKNNLKDRLEIKLTGLSIDERCIGDATNAARVREAFLVVPEGAHLHYTGGTKVMATNARMAFKDAGGGDKQASYLDERRSVLRFDDGYEIELLSQNFELRLDDILGLHGINRKSKDEKADPSPTVEDADKILKVVLNEPELTDRLYNIHKKDNNDDKDKRLDLKTAKQNPIMLSELLNIDLSIVHLPEDEWTRKTYEKWCGFLGGGWLEVWCGELVRGIPGESEVSVNVNCTRANGRGFEIDLAIVRGHRPYVISCTTDTDIKLCKSKLFEVAIRARQLGGDLARSALVCLLHGSNNQGAYVEQLRNDVADIWDAPNTPQVFGLCDLKEWEGSDGKPNKSSLEKWLEV